MNATNWVGSVVGKVNLSCRMRRIVFPLSILGVSLVQPAGDSCTMARCRCNGSIGIPRQQGDSIASAGGWTIAAVLGEGAGLSTPPDRRDPIVTARAKPSQSPPPAPTLAFDVRAFAEILRDLRQAPGRGARSVLLAPLRRRRSQPLAYRGLCDPRRGGGGRG